MTALVILLMLIAPAGAQVMPGQTLCQPGTDRCRAVTRPEPAHRSAIPDRVYIPFEREPREVRPSRPFER